LHTDAGLRQRRRAFEYRLLGRIETGVELLCRSHYFLLKALERWKREDPTIAAKVRLELVGVPSDVDRETVERSSVSSLVEVTGYLSHGESLARIRGADLLFLPMHKMPKGRRATIVPGKTYEYMATGLPILAAVPEGDTRDFLTKAGTGLVCEPDDVQGMLRILKDQFQAWQAGKQAVTWNRSYVERFERRELTRQLADELREVIGRSREG
jgi:glycosyltransferase involved in cell wall biosynthesis